MAYATAAELAQWMGRPPFTGTDVDRAEFLIAMAAAAIEEEAGQALEQSTDTELLDGTGTCELVLPRWPVNDVTTVTEFDTDGTSEVLVEGPADDYTWSAAGVLTRIGAVWPCFDQSVEVVYQAGFTPIPNGLKRIALRLSAGSWDNTTGVESERLGQWQTKWISGDAGVLGMELTTGDKRVISAYRART